MLEEYEAIYSIMIAEERNSNIELLRIFSMLMIVVHHIIVHGLEGASVDSLPWTKIIDCLVIYGVNIFVLISGYFTIKLTWKSFFALMWIIAFYKLFHLVTDTFFLGVSHSLFEWIAKPLSGPISGGGWFVDIYVLLMLVSPILNKFLSCADSRDYKIAIIILLILDVGYGWMMGKHFDQYGYSLLHFVTLYFIGNGLFKFGSCNKSVITFSLCVLLIVYLILSCFFEKQPKYIVMQSYANPLVIVISVCFFLLFSRLKMQKSKFINWIAASMLPVYLIHDGGNVGLWYYGKIGYLWNNESSVIFLIGAVSSVIFLFTFTLIIDQIRRLLSPYVVNALSRLANRLTEMHFVH